MKLKLIIGLIVAAGLAGGTAWGLHAWQNKSAPPPSKLVWGSVDVREVSLAFEAEGRIQTLTKEEGDPVRKGEVLGVLNTELLEIQKARSEAELRRLEAQYRLSRAGFRTEEIVKAKANAEAVLQSLTLARIEEKREEALLRVHASSREEFDQAQWSRKALESQYEAAQAEAKRVAAGNRTDEVAAAEAERDFAKTNVDELVYQIERASRIISPVDGIVRSRLAEPGDITTDSNTIYQISIITPKWVRAYVTEAQLGMVRLGAKARVVTDTTPPLEAKVGSVSSLTDFTPKTAQTAELRAALIYEVRLIVDDPRNNLKLGQPAGVDFEPSEEKDPFASKTFP